MAAAEHIYISASGHFLASGGWWMVITYTVVHFGTSNYCILSSFLRVDDLGELRTAAHRVAWNLC
jgi:hypothetical protein